MADPIAPAPAVPTIPSLSMSWFPNPPGQGQGMYPSWMNPGWSPANPSQASGWGYGSSLQNPATGYLQSTPQMPQNGMAVPNPAVAPPTTGGVLGGIPVAPTVPMNRAGTSYTGNSMGMQDGTNFGVNMPQSISGKSSAEIKADMARAGGQDLAQWQLGIGAGLGLLNFGLGAYSLYKSGQQGDFQMGLARENLAKSIESYDKAREDRITGRYGKQDTAEGQAALQKKIEESRLKSSNV